MRSKLRYEFNSTQVEFFNFLIDPPQKGADWTFELEVK